MKDRIKEILNAFTQQEMGNKITQFNMTGLHVAVLNVFEEEANDDGINATADVSKGDAEGSE